MKSQKGFAVLEGLLILVIVGIVGGTGYYVWHSKAQADKNLDNAAADKISSSVKKTVKPEAPADETADWLTYKAPDGSYSLKIADGWKLTKQTDSALSLVGFTNQDITYAKGTKGQVVIQPGGRDGPIPFMLGVIGKDGFDKPNTRGDKQTGFKTQQGIEVEKYIFTQTEEPQGPDLPKGGKAFMYVISKGATAVEIFHDETPGEPNNVDTVEKIVKTLAL
jgi:hypothetical protein